MTQADRVDRIAQHAARLLCTGRARTVSEAISLSGESAGVSRSLIVRHLAAMEQSALGEVAVNVRRAAILEVALEFMEILDSHFERFTEVFPDARGTQLAGRAAEGLLDGDPIVHIRVLAKISVAELTNLIMETGCEEPIFDLLESRCGKLDRLRTRLNGIGVVLVVCPLGRVPADVHDLVRGTPVSLADRDGVEALREELLGVG